MKKIKKILIIIQRSNGDVFLSLSLINNLYRYYQSPDIDLLVNDDTYSIAKLLPNVNFIHQFSYLEKKNNRFKQEKNLFIALYKKYDLSINLTASDRSNIYALIAGKKHISAIEMDIYKSWWKRLFLNHYYFFDTSKHILLNNLEPLKILNIDFKKVQEGIDFSKEEYSKIEHKLKQRGIKKFIIFHPSAQHLYKVYPKNLRDKLLNLLNTLEIPIIITGGNSQIDLKIKNEIPKLSNIFNFIGLTSLREYFILSKLSIAYIGMDTLNMHIAASQNKRIFAIFGPTKLSMWSPWSNQLNRSTLINQSIQTYGNNTIFQSTISCKFCGKVGCGDMHNETEFQFDIESEEIFKKINNWLPKAINRISIPNVYETSISYRKILLYIVYGEDESYYDGAIYSFLTFKNWISESDQIEVVVLTEKPQKFADYPIKIFKISDDQISDWSLGGKYHFRIKNRGLAYVMDKLKLQDFDKILFFDTDTYFHKSPLQLFELIKSDQALFYLNEGLIQKRKRFSVYTDNLKNKKIKIDNDFYEISDNSAIWGSLMIGVSSNMRHSIEWADKLMVKLFYIVPSHTIEPFSLSESLLRNYKIVEGKSFVSLYSTSRKKEFVKIILSKFLFDTKSLTLDEKIRIAQNLKIKRPLLVILKQRLERLL